MSCKNIKEFALRLVSVFLLSFSLAFATPQAAEAGQDASQGTDVCVQIIDEWDELNQENPASDEEPNLDEEEESTWFVHDSRSSSTKAILPKTGDNLVAILAMLAAACASAIALSIHSLFFHLSQKRK